MDISRKIKTTVLHFVEIITKEWISFWFILPASWNSVFSSLRHFTSLYHYSHHTLFRCSISDYKFTCSTNHFNRLVLPVA